MRSPTLRQIQAFKAFVETGTVSKAADMLFISQPAASKLLTHLEEDTGLHLLDREHGKTNVTERGMRLYDEIERIFSGVDQISQAIETIRQEDRGHLTIGVMPAIPGALIADVTRTFGQKYPEVYLSFHSRSSQFIVDGILGRKFDFGLVIKPLDHDQFTTEILDDAPLVAVVSTDHSLARQKVMRLKDMCSHPVIGYSKGSITRHALERLVLSRGMELDIVLEATTASLIIELVAQNLGIAATLPIMMCQSIKDVTFIPMEEEIILPIHVVRASKSRRDKMINDFIAMFKKVLVTRRGF